MAFVVSAFATCLLILPLADTVIAESEVPYTVVGMSKDAASIEWFLEKIELSSSPRSNEQQLVRSAVQIIWDHVSELSLVDELVSRLPATRRTLERRFRQVLGRSIREVIAMARLEQAKLLLRTTGLAIHEVACNAGYSSSDSLGKAMQKNEGMTPSEYRCKAVE